MSDQPTPRFSLKNDRVFLATCLTAALLIRLYFFYGLSLHDDVSYWMQAIATGLGNSWPPLKTHWHTRIGFILPCALLLKIFGLKVWAPYIFTMIGGLLEVALTFYIARQFVSEAAARLATWLCVFFPLNIVYSSHLYVDLWIGFLGAVSLLFWHRALHSNRAMEYALASLLFGLGWLFRETIVMYAPIYMALWIQAGRWRRPKLLWVLPPALFILAGEMLLYQLTAHNWHYRLDAILHQQNDASNLELIASSSAGGGFWLDPIFQLFVSHHLSLYLWPALALAVFCWRRMPKVLALWLLVGFVWLSWGTTILTGWVTLQRDPRYLSVLTIPCLTLLAVWLVSLRRKFWSAAAIAALIASGLLGAALDIGPAKLSAYRRFAVSEYNQPATALEPFVYFGVRAAQNFSPEMARFACASDLGRTHTVKQIPHLPDARLTACRNARYLILSAQIQPEKWKTKIKEGWLKVDEFPGDHNFARDFVATLFTHGRLQNLHPAPMMHSIDLLVLENPAWAQEVTPPTVSPK